MLLVDTSVLIAQFRNFDPKRVVWFKTEPAAICGMVKAEFLAGARTAKQEADCVAILAALLPVATPESVWDAAGRNQAMLRSNGLNVPLDDTIIATTAIIVDIELWAYDGHFTAMATLLPSLRLFREP